MIVGDIRNSDSGLRQHGTFLLLYVLFSHCGARKEHTKGNKSVNYVDLRIHFRLAGRK